MLPVEDAAQSSLLFLLCLLEAEQQVACDVRLVDRQLLLLLASRCLIDLAVVLQLVEQLTILLELVADGLRLSQLLVGVLLQQLLHHSLLLSELGRQQSGVPLAVIVSKLLVE